LCRGINAPLHTGHSGWRTGDGTSLEEGASPGERVLICILRFLPADDSDNLPRKRIPDKWKGVQYR
jgi:hypothetical protein